MMTAGWLLLGLAILGFAPGADPTGAEAEVSGLVAKLGATRKADRDRASSRLEAIGEVAIPGLLKAAEGRDLELRARAAAVLDAIEGRSMARPTMITLDFRDRPVGEVVDAIAERTGLGLLLDTQADPRRGDRKITANTPEPVTFWEAVERIGKAAGLRADLQSPGGWNRVVMMGPGGFNNRGLNPAVGQPARVRRPATGQEIILTPDLGMPPPPNSRSGRFLVEVTNIHHQRDRTLGAPGGRRPLEVAIDRFEVRLRVLAEPGLIVGKVGEAEAIEAVDDRGRPLSVLPAVPEPNVYHDPSAARGVAIAIRLRYPDDPGRSIARLKGRFGVTVVGHRPDPIAASLVTGLDVPVRKDDMTLVVHSVRPDPAVPAVRLVDLSISRPELLGANVYGGINQNRPAKTPPPMTQGWFEFVDDQGRQVERVAATNFLMGDGQRRTIRVTQQGATGPPVMVRYLAPSWTTLAVPFEFRDLPMP